MARSYTLKGLVDDNGLPLVNVWCQAFYMANNVLIETQYTDTSGDVAFSAIPDNGKAYILAKWGTKAARHPIEMEGAVTTGTLTCGNAAVTLGPGGITLDDDVGNYAVIVYKGTHNSVVTGGYLGYDKTTNMLHVIIDNDTFSSNTNPGMWLLADVGNIWVTTAAAGGIIPTDSQSFDLGSSTYPWDDVHCVDVVDYSRMKLDYLQPIDLLRKVKNKPDGIELDKESLPEDILRRPTEKDFKQADDKYFRDKAGYEAGKLKKPPKKAIPKAGFSIPSMMGLLIASIKELTDRVEKLEKK